MCDLPADRCPGPGCERSLSPTDQNPDFCSTSCANGWHAANRPTTLAIDGGLGAVKGANYGGGSTPISHASNVLAFAPSWLDARPHPDDEAVPS